MKVRDTNIIKFSLMARKATIQLTPRIEIEVDENTIIMHKYCTGYGGYAIVEVKDGKKYKSWILSTRVAKQISKYFEFTHEDFNYDYAKFPFDKFYK